MCFVKDYDYCPEISDESEGVATEGARCDECSRPFAADQPCYAIHTQRYETCRLCRCPDLEDDEEDEDQCCTCAEPDYGEIYDYLRCMDCHCFLQAVEQAEIEAGCSRYDATPYLEHLTESLSDLGEDDCVRYWKTAVEMFPGLYRSGYLDWLHQKVFA